MPDRKDSETVKEAPSRRKMAFLRTFFSKSRKKKDYPFITRDVDPEATWEIVGKLGDGAFGEVFKVR